MTSPAPRLTDHDTQPIPVVGNAIPRGRHAAPRRPLRVDGGVLVILREIGIALGIAIAVLLVGRMLVGQIVPVADDAMQPSLAPGDRVLVTPWGDPSPGAIALVRAPASWGATGEEALVRIIAVGGQTVACCDAQGRIIVDGEPIDEAYVIGPTDQVPFEVMVPTGRVFVLADRRDTARDSRALLGDPDGGTISVDDVIGRVLVVAWPPRVPAA